MEDSDDELYCQALYSFEHPGAVQRPGMVDHNVGAASKPLQALNGQSALGAATSSAPAARPAPAPACSNVRSLFLSASRQAGAPQHPCGPFQQHYQPLPAQQQSSWPSRQDQQLQQQKRAQPQQQEPLPRIVTEGLAPKYAAGHRPGVANGAVCSRGGPSTQHAAPTSEAGQHQVAGAAQQQPSLDAAAAAAPAAGIDACSAPAASAAPAPAPAPAAAAVGAPPQKRRLRQLFDYLLVLDLEATCDRDKATQPMPQEVRPGGVWGGGGGGLALGGRGRGRGKGFGITRSQGSSAASPAPALRRLCSRWACTGHPALLSVPLRKHVPPW
jgi:hypothetical protein